ncbi:MAG: hypothetical protein UH249_00530 [Acutalibacteraceae bacterium]|nr:hypothetical protein [Acutalibacteraceae bacterium]
MKKITKFLCFVLCVVLVSVSLPVYVSAESGFVSFNVIGSADGEKEVFEEYGYSDGTHLYVSTDFLTRYMPYSYDASQNMFTRINHEAGSWFGTVKVDPQAKQATLYMNTFSNKTYNLHDALYFGNRLYLPIDQMAALLKTTLLHEESEGEHYIAVGCCEYSICDAEYALSKIQNHKYLYFDYPEIIDEIFYGNDALFYSATVLSYFSSTIFGFRLDQLDVIFQSGKVNDYRDYLDRCILDNEAYMTYVLDEDSVGYRFIETMNLNSKVGGISSDLEEYLSYVKELTEPFKDSSLSGSSLYKDASDYATIFGTIGEVCEWADFIMKYESVLNDNYDMLSYYIAFSSLLSEEIPFIKAVVETSNTYSEDYVQMGLQKLYDSLSDLLSGYGTKEALKTIFPEIEIVFLAIKAINLVTQALGIDLTDNTNYSILLECAARNSIGSYARDLPDDHFTGVSSVEKYRTANLFWVLGSKQIFDSANKLNAKYGGGSSVYDSRKDVLCQVAGLFYLAAQGEGFDDYPSIDRLISQNHTQIQNSNVLTNFSDVSEEDIPEHEEVTSEFLEATQEDFDRFWKEGHSSLLGYVVLSSGDMSTMSDMEFFKKFFCYGGDGRSLLYYYYYGNVPEWQPIDFKTTPDPRGSFDPAKDGCTASSYYRYPAEKVDWIMKNIFNITPTHRDGFVSDKNYYENGYYYLESVGVCGPSDSYNVEDYIRMDDGKYKVVVSYRDVFDEEEYAKAELVIGLKEIDGKREWVFYKINAVHKDGTIL